MSEVSETVMFAFSIGGNSPPHPHLTSAGIFRAAHTPCEAAAEVHVATHTHTPSLCIGLAKAVGKERDDVISDVLPAAADPVLMPLGTRRSGGGGVVAWWGVGWGVIKSIAECLQTAAGPFYG